MLKIHIKITCSIIIACVVFMLSCATVSETSSNTPIHNKTITENLGKVEGNSSYVFALFGIWMFGRPDIQTAIDDALSKKGGDALINIKYHESWIYFIVGSLTKVTIEGEAVRLNQYEPEKK